MKKYILNVLAIIAILGLSCTREYTCECTDSYNGVQVNKFTYDATGTLEKELCDDADRQQDKELTQEVLDSLSGEGLDLHYPEDTLVTYKRVCEAK